MAIELKTTSQIISYHTTLENKMTEIYEGLAKSYPRHASLFKKLVKENRSHRDRVIRVYREGVTDAYEVSFLGQSIRPNDYQINEVTNLSLSLEIQKSIDNEEIIILFCKDILNSSIELIPNLHETFEQLLKWKKRRVELLENLITVES
jgi:hypothetical protein